MNLRKEKRCNQEKIFHTKGRSCVYQENAQEQLKTLMLAYFLKSKQIKLILNQMESFRILTMKF